MNLYYTIYLFLLVFSLFEIGQKNKIFSSFTYSLFLLLFLFLGTVRWQTGTDWNSYLLYFINNNSINDFFYNGYAFEKGYVLLNWGVKYLGGNYSAFLFFGVVVNLLCFHIVAKKFLKERLIFALLLYFSVFMGGIFVTRQLLATSICFLSLVFIIERKIIPFSILILLASLFHISSIVFWGAYFMYNYHITVKRFLILFFVVCITSFFIPFIISSLVSFISGSDRLTTKLLIYNTEGREMGVLVFLLGVLKRIVILPLFFYFVNYYFKQDKIFKGIFSIYLIGTLLYFLFALSGLKDFVRISAYFQLMEIPLFYYAYVGIRKKWIFLLIIPFLAMKIYSAISIYYDEYVPFYTIFENPSRF